MRALLDSSFRCRFDDNNKPLEYDRVTRQMAQMIGGKVVGFMIATVGDMSHQPLERLKWIIKETERIYNLGARRVIFCDILNPDYDVSQIRFGDDISGGDISALWLPGGNPFVLRDALDESGLFGIISEAVSDSSLSSVVAESASSILFGLHKVRLIDYSGVDLAIRPTHDVFGFGLLPSNVEVLRVHQKESRLDLEECEISLRDGDALIVEKGPANANKCEVLL